MILFNGELQAPENVQFTSSNRAFRYGDAVFETMKYTKGKVHFLEDHYFRLMSTMRILRMEIPMHFSPEFLEAQVNEVIAANHAAHNASRIRLTVFRAGAGFYKPETNEVEYLIEATPLPHHEYVLNENGLNIDLFKDFYAHKSMLSNLKTANAQLYVLASIFKSENNLDECVLLNDDKHVVETIASNLFMLMDGVVHTPPLAAGCLKGVMRKNIIGLLRKMKMEVKETLFSPFELQKAQEVWLTNAVNGVQWVGNYRKKQFEKTVATAVVTALNEQLI